MRFKNQKFEVMFNIRLHSSHLQLSTTACIISTRTSNCGSSHTELYILGITSFGPETTGPATQSSITYTVYYYLLYWKAALSSVIISIPFSLKPTYVEKL